MRAKEPVRISIGPVLHPDDAVANKMGALYERALARDFIDIDAALRSGRYDRRDAAADSPSVRTSPSTGACSPTRSPRRRCSTTTTSPSTAWSARTSTVCGNGSPPGGRTCCAPTADAVPGRGVGQPTRTPHRPMWTPRRHCSPSPICRAAPAGRRAFPRRFARRCASLFDAIASGMRDPCRIARHDLKGGPMDQLAQPDPRRGRGARRPARGRPLRHRRRPDGHAGRDGLPGRVARSASRAGPRAPRRSSTRRSTWCRRRSTASRSPRTRSRRAGSSSTDLAADNVLVVESVQSETAAGEWVHRSVDPSDKEVYVWTSFEPDDARRAWACFDQPDLKAPHGFTVLAPAAWMVVSNSGDPVVTRHDGGGRRWKFPDTPPLSTYVPVINAGPFHEIRSERGGYDLGLLSPAVARAVPRPRRRGAVRGHRAGARVLRRPVRPAVPATQVRPGLPARHGRRDGELRLRDLVRRLRLPQRSDLHRARAAGRRCCCTRWRTCGSATW